MIEGLDNVWVAFSPHSGESLLLNDECASILEVLESGAADTAAVCSALAADSGLDANNMLGLVDAAWPRLVEAGLVREWPSCDVGTK